jgi:hypothetical protein
MTSIERTTHGMVVFLDCGCAAWRGLTHPTGEAVLVEIIERCQSHASDRTRFRAVRKGEQVKPWVRSPVQINPVRAQ